MQHNFYINIHTNHHGIIIVIRQIDPVFSSYRASFTFPHVLAIGPYSVGDFEREYGLK